MLEDSVVINKCYILRERIGEDTFSEWWRASSIFTASDFLLRFLKDEYGDEAPAQDFATAARDRYGVVAPSILDLVEADRYEGKLFLASEFAGHKSLRTALDAGLRCSVEHACRFILEIAEGVDEFHRRGMVYGLLTPETIALRRSGDLIDEIKILKPGYVLLLPLIPEDRIEDLRENWGYAAPELKRGEVPSAAGDIYALGVLLFRLLTGKLPYGSRSGLRVKERSAAPTHIAAALARRGMPRELTSIVVRALRKNPGLRYGDVLDFVAELRTLLESRREERLRTGGSDPLADLAMLNLKRANAGAREIKRSLETVDYFRLLSEAALRDKDAELLPLEAPFEPAEEEALRELEDREAEGDEDDDSMSVEQILDIGYAAEGARAVIREYPPQVSIAPKSVVKAAERAESPFANADWSESRNAGAISYAKHTKITKPATEIDAVKQEEPLPAAPREARPIPVHSPPPSPASVALPSASLLPPSQPPRPDPPPALPPAPPSVTLSALEAAPATKEAVQSAKRETLPKPSSVPAEEPVGWNRSGGNPEAVSAALMAMFKRTARGRGSFRFIENPGAGRPAELMANAMDEMRSSGFVVDLGALPRGIEFEALLALLRTALALAVLDAGRRRRGTLAKRLIAADGEGFLRGAPLGFVLERKNASAPAITQENQDEVAKKAAHALIAMSSKSRPLVLLAHGTEAIGPSAHRFFLKLAAAAATAPVCVFLFFFPGEVESWHVLSALNEPKG